MLQDEAPENEEEGEEAEEEGGAGRAKRRKGGRAAGSPAAKRARGAATGALEAANAEALDFARIRREFRKALDKRGQDKVRLSGPSQQTSAGSIAISRVLLVGELPPRLEPRGPDRGSPHAHALQVAEEYRSSIETLAAALEKAAPNMKALEQFEAIKSKEKEQVRPGPGRRPPGGVSRLPVAPSLPREGWTGLQGCTSTWCQVTLHA